MLLVLGAVALQAASLDKRRFEIAGGDAATTLRIYTEQSGEEVVYVVPRVRGVTTNAVRGEFTTAEAIERMVANTALRVVRDEKTGALLINRASPEKPPRAEASPENPANSSTHKQTMKSKNPLALFGAWLALLGSPAAAAETSANAATLHGVVVNAATDNYVAGASVLLEGPNRTERTDSQGRFTFGGVSAGRHRVVVDSLGVGRTETSVELTPGQSATITVRLQSEVVAMAPLMVTAQVEGQAQSLNLQKNAESIRNVVSEDALANSRLGEVGEALQSIPGVFLEVSTHQPVRAFVRGLASDYNAVTFDGIGIGTWQGTRDAQVGTFPAENLARVEVIKSATPDREGDAIGGAINLVSKRAFDLPGRQLRLGAGASYSNQQQVWDKQVNVDYGDRFGREGRLGVFSSVNYYRTDRAYHNVAQTYQVSAADVFNIATMTLLDRIEKGSWKLKYTGSIDYKLSDATSLSLRGLYSNDRRFLADYRAVWRPGARTNITPDTATANNGRVDVDRPYREPQTINYQISLNLEHTAGLWKLDSTLGFNRISNTYSETITPLMSINGVNMAYDRAERDFPAFTVTNGVSLADPARLTWGAITRNQYNSRNLGYNLALNARRDLAESQFKSYVKTGFLARLKDWRQDVGDQGNWTYTGALPASAFAMPYDNDRFMRQADGRIQMPGVTPDVKKIIEAFHARRSDFTRNDNASEILLATNKKGFFEGVYSGYLMGGARFGALNVITGARLEVTDFEGWAHRIDTPRGILSSVTHVKTATESRDLLPSVNVIYSFRRDLQLRAAVTKTLARPNPQDLLPVRRVTEDTRVVTDGNPDLGVTESMNYDLGLEYYLKPLGVASIGVFEKRIEGFYVDQVETITVGEFAGYQLSRPGMGRGGKIRGVEADFQKRLTFLPGWLSGLGVGANHTWLESEGTYPNRPNDTLPFAGAPKETTNFNVFFARGPIDLRVFVNLRGPYLDGVGARRALDVYEDERTTLNFFAKYKVSRRLTLHMDVNNITDSSKRSYQGDPSNPRSVRYFDWAANFRATWSL